MTRNGLAGGAKNRNKKIERSGLTLAQFTSLSCTFKKVPSARVVKLVNTAAFKAAA